MKFFKKLICITLCIALCAFTFSACKEEENKPDNTPTEPTIVFDSQVKNVILFIGDGMGYNHVEQSIHYFNLDRPAFLNDEIASVSTRAKNALTTDSAAAATAMATGNRVDRTEIGMHKGEILENISEIAKRAGKKVGVVTTDLLSGATPAGFSAHASDRDETMQIALSQTTSNVDLLIGRASEDFYYYNNAREDFEAQGYTFAVDEDQLIQNKNAQKLIATLDMPYSTYSPEPQPEAMQICDLLQFSIDYLTNDNGYFLMIESAYIDKFSHDNEYEKAMAEVRSMIDAIDYLYANMPADTALLITADHETGGLVEPGKTAVGGKLYASRSHTGVNAGLWGKNVKLQNVTNGCVENYFIFDICITLLNIENYKTVLA